MYIEVHYTSRFVKCDYAFYLCGDHIIQNKTGDCVISSSTRSSCQDKIKLVRILLGEMPV